MKSLQEFLSTCVVVHVQQSICGGIVCGTYADSLITRQRFSYLLRHDNAFLSIVALSFHILLDRCADTRHPDTVSHRFQSSEDHKKNYLIYPVFRSCMCRS